jgi:hypothetical protein
MRYIDTAESTSVDRQILRSMSARVKAVAFRVQLRLILSLWRSEPGSCAEGCYDNQSNEGSPTARVLLAVGRCAAKFALPYPFAILCASGGIRVCIVGSRRRNG